MLYFCTFSLDTEKSLFVISFRFFFFKLIISSIKKNAYNCTDRETVLGTMDERDGNEVG